MVNEIAANDKFITKRAPLKKNSISVVNSIATFNLNGSDRKLLYSLNKDCLDFLFEVLILYIHEDLIGCSDHGRIYHAG